MAKPGELDWSDLYKNGHVSKPADDGRPLLKGRNNQETLENQFNSMMCDLKAGFKENGVRQATDEELFGHLVVTEEMAKQAENEWENRYTKTMNDLNKPIDNKEVDWGNCKPTVDTSKMTEEERVARNMKWGD